MIKKFYYLTENTFEKLTAFATKVLGNPISFIIALCMVLFWWATNLFTSNDLHQDIGDIIFGITFLSLFIIQKSFNRYAASVHLKMNELISAHENANNALIHSEIKTEREINKLQEEFNEILEDLSDVKQNE
jgi:low affinity Fe/Cu permease